MDFLPRFKVEIVLPDEQIGSALTVIMQAARTGRSGDGKVFITSVEQVIRIRTEETGLAAI